MGAPATGIRWGSLALARVNRVSLFCAPSRTMRVCPVVGSGQLRAPICLATPWRLN